MIKETAEWFENLLNKEAEHMHTMAYKLQNALDHHQLATQATLIQLEALCRISDNLEALVAALTTPKTPTPKDVRNGRH
ncbi:MAG: hypothetical protein UHD09_09115 [Bifidobacterium sp.]|nr:hypothetical protein [Bifidobacterium sp.]